MKNSPSRFNNLWLFYIGEPAAPRLVGELRYLQLTRGVGAVDDARPDRWGERVTQFVDRPERLSLMEYLCEGLPSLSHRLHSLSAGTVLRSLSVTPIPDLGYPALAQALRRFGNTVDEVNATQMLELFSTHGLQHPHRQHG